VLADGGGGGGAKYNCNNEFLGVFVIIDPWSKELNRFLYVLLTDGNGQMLFYLNLKILAPDDRRTAERSSANNK
jgi:hypothetical protein